MVEKPELSEQEFEQKLTEVAKEAIDQYCVQDDGTVEYVEYAALETVGERELLEKYPLSVEKYGTGTFNADHRERIAESVPSEALTICRKVMLVSALDKRIRTLIDERYTRNKGENKNI